MGVIARFTATALGYRDALMAHMAPGEIFRRVAGDKLPRLMAGIGAELARLQAQAEAEILEVTDPELATAAGQLGRWELLLKPYALIEPATLEADRQLRCALILAMRLEDELDFEALASALGVTDAEVTDFGTYLQVNFPSNSVIAGVHGPPTTHSSAISTGRYVVIEDLITRFRPAHMTVTFLYP